MRKLFQHIRQSLSLKLIIGVLVLATLIFATSLGGQYLQSRRLVKQESVNRAIAELHIVSQHVSSMMTTIETAANSSSWMITEYLHPDSILDLSRRIVMLNANINGCSITTEPNIFPQHGRYFSAYTIREGDSIITVKEEPYEYFEKVWYKTPKELGKATWVDPFDDYNEGTLSAKDPIASYCKPIFNNNNEFIGVLSTDLSLPHLSKLVNSTKPYSGSYFMMIGKEGYLFIHPDSTKILKQTIFSGTDARQQTDIFALGHEMITGASGAQQVYISGEPCIVCYEPIAGTSWSLALVCPEKGFLHRYNNLTYIIVPLIAIGLLLIVLFCHYIIRQALSPLNQLVEQSQRISEGYYDEQIPHTQRTDVVGRLQNSFASMQESINQHINEIQQVNINTAQRNEELAKARKLAEEASQQKMAFIQDVTHQIRTPLNIIIGFAQVLHENSGEMTAEEVRPIADLIKHNTASLSRMILMLYDSSDSAYSQEKASFVFTNISCNKLVEECIECTYNHFPNIHIDFNKTIPDTFSICTSYLYLMRSLRELLYNSAKYSDGKNISVQVVPTEENSVQFIFEDTGPGIAEENLDKLFKPFTKVNDLSEGLGLGLPLIKNHIQALNGKLIYDKHYRKGCRFIVEMPVS